MGRKPMLLLMIISELKGNKEEYYLLDKKKAPDVSRAFNYLEVAVYCPNTFFSMSEVRAIGSLRIFASSWAT